MKTFCNYCGKEKTNTNPAICEHCGRFPKTDREKAMEWWNSQVYQNKKLFYHHYFGADLDNGEWDDEIEQIWRYETSNISIKLTNPMKDASITCIDRKGKKTVEYPLRNNKGIQVDFEMLKETISKVKALTNCTFSGHEEDNFRLFFKLLSQNASFAHKAHKELQRLNKL